MLVYNGRGVADSQVYTVYYAMWFAAFVTLCLIIYHLAPIVA